MKIGLVLFLEIIMSVTNEPTNKQTTVILYFLTEV